MDRRRVRDLLTAKAYRILSTLTHTLNTVLAVTACNETHEVRVIAAPRAAIEAARVPGDHLSPPEEKVWNALEGGPKTRKQLAKLTGMAEKGKLKYLLPNLVARKVLVHHPLGHGYRRANQVPAAPLPGAEAAEDSVRCETQAQRPKSA